MAGDGQSEESNAQTARAQLLLLLGCSLRTGEAGLFVFMQQMKLVMEGTLPDTDTPALARIGADHPLETYSLDELVLEFSALTSKWNILEVRHHPSYVGTPTRVL